MTTRILLPDEWSKLAGTELEPLFPLLDPEKATIFVVEDDAGIIVGCWSALSMIHAEGLWIASTHRKTTSVFRRLLTAMRQELAKRHEGVLWTSATTEDVQQIIVHTGGVPIPGTHYAIPVL